MKNKRLFLCVALALVLTVTMCSCSAKENAEAILGYVRSQVELVRDEYDDIVEFFGYEPTPSDVIVTPSASFANEDSEIEPTLVYGRHVEIVESPYNSAARTVIFSSGSVDLSDKSGILPESDVRGYTKIPRMADMGLDAVCEILDGCGIEYSITEKKNPSPVDDVFALEFAGVSDSEAYYINPAVPITLYVSAPKPTKMSEPGRMTVYLTYDDGPNAALTEKLLDVLDTYGVKAAFFTMGNSVKRYPDAARAIAERGHILACHSVTHDYEAIYASTDALEAEVREWEKIVAEAGIELSTKMFRFPGGSVNKYLTDAEASDIKSRLSVMGYTVYDWNVVTNDSLLFMREEENVYEYIKRNFIETFEYALKEREKKDAPIIILMHEGVEETVDLMPWMIEYLMSEGYTFGSLADLESSWTFADRK